MSRTPLVFFLVPVAAFVIALALTGLVRRYALRGALLDVPNPRSLHRVPTPRGGGLGVVVAFLAAVAAVALLERDWWPAGAALAGVTLALGTLGWVDDHHDLAQAPRLVAQIAVAVAAVALIGPIRELRLGEYVFPLAWLAWPATLLWLVGLTNFYNFMDGIDGIAGGQAVLAAGTLAVWFTACGRADLALLCLGLAGAALGFLTWNWPPARIFMGDVGSVTLGALFGLLAVIGVVQCGLPWSAFVILLGIFLADATLTLLRRMLAGEAWFRPHHSHFYQRAVRTGLSHRQVTGAVLGAGLLLAGLATLDALRVAPGWLWPILAGLLLGLLVMLVKWRERRGGAGTVGLHRRPRADNE